MDSPRLDMQRSAGRFSVPFASFFAVTRRLRGLSEIDADLADVAADSAAALKGLMFRS